MEEGVHAHERWVLGAKRGQVEVDIHRGAVRIDVHHGGECRLCLDHRVCRRSCVRRADQVQGLPHHLGVRFALDDMSADFIEVSLEIGQGPATGNEAEDVLLRFLWIRDHLPIKEHGDIDRLKLGDHGDKGAEIMDGVDLAEVGFEGFEASRFDACDVHARFEEGTGLAAIGHEKGVQLPHVTCLDNVPRTSPLLPIVRDLRVFLESAAGKLVKVGAGVGMAVHVL
mmetsp:Transcript_37804/g.88371  ORF Transcript_37804/g.88371 Transcript_37804/m.88371 type:complete len:226 (+) Transcript_37804:1331-2008(+)